MEHTGTTQLVRVFIPDAKTQKCIVLNMADTVWAAKQVITDKVYQELPRDPLNYSLYMPATGSGKLGKFMDDGLLLSDYALQGNLPKVEMRYKCRDYSKQVSLTEKSIVKANSKANQRKLIEYVGSSSYKKIDKILESGLDPNFLTDNGNTPLGLACGRGRSVQSIQSLLSGGAHIDFRGKDGLTPMHRAAIGGNALAINSLLSYGATPNYRDIKGLTPLYHTSIMGDNTGACLTLLRNRAELGIKDQGGWSELHHTSKYGHVQHAELFIRYGADINDQNLVGNTPLHVAASHGQRACALTLLKRGADKTKTNFSGQTPSQVSILCGHHQLATEINEFTSSQVEPVSLSPEYNESARATQRFKAPLKTCSIKPSAESLVDTLVQEWDDEEAAKVEEEITPQPSRVKKLSTSTTGRPGSASSQASSRSHTSSSFRIPDTESLNSVEMGSTHSDSTGAPGTPGPSTPKMSFGQQRERLYRAGPGKYMVVQDVEPQQPGDIPLRCGMAVEVTYIGKGGYWEGKAGGQEGWFPRLAIKEKEEEQYDYHVENDPPRTPVKTEAPVTPSGKRMSNIRELIIHRGNKGYGFAMRGVRATKAMQFRPTPEVPALQYVGNVEETGAAATAGLNTGDFIIEVNGHNVTHSTHDEVVAIVRKAGDSLQMKIITPLMKPKSVSQHLKDQLTPVSTPEAPRKQPSPIPVRTPEIVKTGIDRETIIGDTAIGRTDSPMLANLEASGWDSSQDDSESLIQKEYSPHLPSKLSKGALSIKSYSHEASTPPASSRSQTLPVLPTKDYPKLEEIANSNSSSNDEEEVEGQLSEFEKALRQNKAKINRKSESFSARERSNTMPESASSVVNRKTASESSSSLMTDQILQASKARKERVDANQLKMTPKSSPNPLRDNPLAKAMSMKIDNIVIDSDTDSETDAPPSPFRSNLKPVKKAPPPVTKPKPMKRRVTSPSFTELKTTPKAASPLLQRKQAPPTETDTPPQDSLDFELPPPIPADDKRPDSFIDIAPPTGFSLDRAEESETSMDEFIPPPLPQTSPPPTQPLRESGFFIFPDQEDPPTTSSLSPAGTRSSPLKIPNSRSIDKLPSPMPSPPGGENVLDISNSAVVPPPEFGKQSPWSPSSDEIPPPLPQESPPPLDLDEDSKPSDQTVDQFDGAANETVVQMTVTDLSDVDIPPPRPPLPAIVPSPSSAPKFNKQAAVEQEPAMDNSIAPETTPQPAEGFTSQSASSLANQPPSPVESGYKTKPVVEWEASDVVQWLKDIKLGEYADSFEENEIIGEHLVDLSRDDLKELGIKKIGHQKTFLLKISQLTK